MQPAGCGSGHAAGTRRARRGLGPGNRHGRKQRHDDADGQALVTGLAYGNLLIWDLTASPPKERARVASTIWNVASLALSPDGRTLVSGGPAGAVRCWDLAATPPRERIPLHGHASSVSSLSFSPDGRMLASASKEAVRLWDLGGAAPWERAVLPDAGWHIRFAPDGKTLLTATQGPRLWDVTVNPPKEKARLDWHSHGPVGMAFSGDGNLLAVGSYGPVLRLWDLGGDKPRQRFVLDEKDGKGVQSLALSADGTLLAAGTDSGDRILRLWRVTEKGLRRLPTPPVEARHVAFAPDGKTLAYNGDDWAIHLWDLTSPVPVTRATLEGHKLPGWSGVVRDFAFSADGRRLVSGGQDRRVIVWDAASGQKLHEWKMPAEVNAVALAPDGRHVAIGNWNGTIYLVRY